MLRCGNFLVRGIYYSTAAALSRTETIHPFAQRAHEIYCSVLKVTEGYASPKRAVITPFCLSRRLLVFDAGDPDFGEHQFNLSKPWMDDSAADVPHSSPRR